MTGPFQRRSRSSVSPGPNSESEVDPRLSLHFCGRGIFHHFSGDATGPGASDGLLLSSSDLGRSPCAPAGRSLMELLMPAVVLAIAVSYISLWLATVPAAIAAFALSGIAQSVHWLGGIRVADVRLATPDKAIITISAACIVAAILALRKSKWPAAVSFALLFASAASVWAIHPRQKIRPGFLEVTAIDVSQGDSILLVLPNGGTVLLGFLSGCTRKWI
jgi:hypothetical protein